MLNQTAIYAIRAMGFIAKQGKDVPILSSVVAAEMDIPRNFLSKIIHRLSQAGLIIAARGRGGGVKLSRPASEIALYEVVEQFMKLDDFKRCFIGSSGCDGSCGLHERWHKISDEFELLLNDTTVDQIFSGSPSG